MDTGQAGASEKAAPNACRRMNVKPDPQGHAQIRKQQQTVAIV